MVEVSYVGADHVRHLPSTDGGQNDLVQELPICSRRARLPFRIRMLGEKSFRELGDGRRLFPRDLVCAGIGTTLDQAEQPLRLAPSRVGRPWRPMLANRQLAQW